MIGITYLAIEKPDKTISACIVDTWWNLSAAIANEKRLALTLKKIYKTWNDDDETCDKYVFNNEKEYIKDCSPKADCINLIRYKNPSVCYVYNRKNKKFEKI